MVPKSVNSASLTPKLSGSSAGKRACERADGANSAAHGAGIAGRDDVARADAGHGEAAEGVAAVEKALVDRHRGAVIAGDIARIGRAGCRSGVVEQRRIGGEVDAGVDVFQIAAEAGEVWRSEKVAPLVGLRTSSRSV